MTLDYTAYITVDELRDLTRDQLTANDQEYERSIKAASQVVGDYCGRVFYQTPVPTAKLFRTEEIDLVWTQDISTPTGLIVETDFDQDGVFEVTWAASDYQLEPFIRKDGEPFDRISAVGSKMFPVPNLNSFNFGGQFRWSRRALIRITAAWGWPAVPPNVKMATAIQAMDNFRAKDLTHVAATYGNEVRVARDYSPGSFGRKVRFTRTRSPMLNPQAEALISSLRITVVA